MELVEYTKLQKQQTQRSPKASRNPPECLTRCQNGFHREIVEIGDDWLHTDLLDAHVMLELVQLAACIPIALSLSTA